MMFGRLMRSEFPNTSCQAGHSAGPKFYFRPERPAGSSFTRNDVALLFHPFLFVRRIRYMQYLTRRVTCIYTQNPDLPGQRDYPGARGAWSLSGNGSKRHSSKEHLSDSFFNKYQYRHEYHLSSCLPTGLQSLCSFIRINGLHMNS